MQETAALKDEGADLVLESAAAKLFATEMVGRVADRAVQIFGGAGYIADYGIERLYRDVRLFRLYEGTSQIQQLIIARDAETQGVAGAIRARQLPRPAHSLLMASAPSVHRTPDSRYSPTDHRPNRLARYRATSGAKPAPMNQAALETMAAPV